MLTAPRRSLNRFLWLVALLILSSVSQTTLSSELESSPAIWIDVRSWIEYQADNIEGDTRIHVDEIVEGVTAAFPNKETPIRLYCAVGGRAGKATKLLQDAGYQDVKNIGGISDARRIRGLE